ncbi:MAG: cytochrome c biogenesis protein CcsA [Phycisphaeraceae bacterium]|nr:MAG: cytochrome c biogenesis protein CcsA [Phycisphaeraceae bacterium]
MTSITIDRTGRLRRLAVLLLIPVVLVVSPDLLAQQPTGTVERAPSGAAAGGSFESRVNLTALGHLAVHSNGRLKSLDSFTTAVMQVITGPHRIGGQHRTFTYLDMMFRPENYFERDVIYVPKKIVRERLVQAMRRDPALTADLSSRLDRFMKTGLIAESILRRRDVNAEMSALRGDLIKTARFVEDVDFARQMMHPANLEGGLRLIPQPGGGELDPWLTPAEFIGADWTGTPGFDAAMQADVRGAWETLRDGWRRQDADAVNRAIDRLAAAARHINPALYPSGARTGWPWSFSGDGAAAAWVAAILTIAAFLGMGAFGFATARPRLGLLGAMIAGALCLMQAGALVIGRFDALALESMYFNNHHWFTLNWVVYLLAMVPLLMGVVYRWRGAHAAGMAMFLLAFAFQTAALLLRWYVADRWPNSNMFEAVTTAAWFGGCGAIIMEMIVWRTGMRNLFALGSAAGSMTALMAAHFLPQALNANISNRMPVLDDVWLYIHTNVIIFSYALIFMAAIVAGLYMIYRFIARLNGFGGTHHYARVGGAGTLIALGGGEAVGSQPSPVNTDTQQPTAESPPALGTRHSARSSPSRLTVGQVFDGATMILMELSFILLWAGIVMGAMWADHSWGRPWGWDPKEVFALNTFIVFAVLVHVRLKVKDKGFWTALLVLFGCVVMLFNWIFINFKIAGLHSYA